MNRTHDNNRSEILMLVSGAGILGAALGMLFAPQSGTKTRRDIRRLTGNFGNQAKDLKSDLKNRIDDWVGTYSQWSRDEPKRESELRAALLDTLQSSREMISERIRSLEKAVRK